MSAAVLDATVPQHVQYAVPIWLRDQQIALANTRQLPRIQPHPELRTERVAVVGFGPSLADTWEQVRDFDYLITCSGSHKFLLDKGLVPTKGQWWHVEVDPRSHKTKLLGTPHADVQYLIASTCHPAVFDHLAGYDVVLWHIFDPKAEGFRVLPASEWALTGGCDVGLRAMTIARFFGFTDLHVFGMDGCQTAIGKHAAEHPNEGKGFAETVYDGVTYLTTPAMLECARQVGHELNQMPDVKATFYGDGLVQHMMRHYVPAPAPPGNPIGFVKPQLISAEYAALNAQLHRENLAYGVGGERHAETVLKLVGTLKPPASVLDYGCGKGLLAKALPFAIWEFDPAIPGKEASPRPADLVVATDVLEHIEPDHLDVVLDDLRRCVKQIGYFVIDTQAALKTLPDGRNTHLIQEDAQWWRLQLQKFFKVATLKVRGRQVHVLVAPKDRPRRASVKASAVVSACAR